MAAGAARSSMAASRSARYVRGRRRQPRRAPAPSAAAPGCSRNSPRTGILTPGGERRLWVNGSATMPKPPPRPSINELCAPLVAALLRDAGALRLGVTRDASGATLVDAGIDASGGIEAGRRIAEICLGGLGRVSVGAAAREGWPWLVTGHAAQPGLASPGSQYARRRPEAPRLFPPGSGPGR